MRRPQPALGRTAGPVALHDKAGSAGAACGGELHQSKAEVRNATPAGGRPAGECAGLERLIESAWWKCIVVVHGTRREVIRRRRDAIATAWLPDGLRGLARRAH